MKYDKESKSTSLSSLMPTKADRSETLRKLGLHESSHEDREEHSRGHESSHREHHSHGHKVGHENSSREYRSKLSHGKRAVRYTKKQDREHHDFGDTIKGWGNQFVGAWKNLGNDISSGNLGNKLQQGGQKAVDTAAPAFPYIGGAIGAGVGGPQGAAIGSQVGSGAQSLYYAQQQKQAQQAQQEEEMRQKQAQEEDMNRRYQQYLQQYPQYQPQYSQASPIRQQYARGDKVHGYHEKEYSRPNGRHRSMNKKNCTNY